MAEILSSYLVDGLLQPGVKTSWVYGSHTIQGTEGLNDVLTVIKDLPAGAILIRGVVIASGAFGSAGNIIVGTRGTDGTGGDPNSILGTTLTTGAINNYAMATVEVLAEPCDVIVTFDATYANPVAGQTIEVIVEYVDSPAGGVSSLIPR